MLGSVGEFHDGGELAVGGKFSFEITPEVIHRVEFRALVGQPEQSDLEPGGELLAADGGVTGRLIEQKPDGPTTIVLAQELEKCAEVILAGMVAAQENAVAGTRVDDAKEDSLCIVPADGHLCLSALHCPARAQWWKES